MSQRVAEALDFKLSRHMTELTMNAQEGVDPTGQAATFIVIDQAIDTLRTAFPQLP